MTKPSGPAHLGARVFLIVFGVIIVLAGLAYCGGRL